MFCHNCGVPQSSDALFCAHCGVRQIAESEVDAETADGEPSDASPAQLQHSSATPARAVTGRMATFVLWFVTAIWVSFASLHAYANWPQLSRLEPGELWDFAIRAIAPISVFWLFMAYIRLASRLRNSEALTLHARLLVSSTETAAASVADLVARARAAVEKVEGEVARLRDLEAARVRSMQPRWELNGCIAHEKALEINLRNSGLAATRLSLAWDKGLPMAAILSDSAMVDRGGTLTIKAMFLEQHLDRFDLKLQYCDGANEPRIADISIANTDVTIRHDRLQPTIAERT